MKRKTVLGSSISIGTYSEFINNIFYLVKNKFPSYVCFANVHMVMEGYKNLSFQNIVNRANLVAPDGKPISLFLKHFEKINQQRICGMDVLPELLKQAETLGRSVYFYGTTDDLLNAIVAKAKAEFPRLIISGFYSPPFHTLSAKENQDILHRIKARAPDLVFVSLGCPKQEKWMAENKYKIGACLLGVGQAFKTYANVEKRLPMWMRNLSLEWIYRLYQEPRRLWKRYLFTNTYFLLLTFQLLIHQMIGKLSNSFANRNIQQTSYLEREK